MYATDAAQGIVLVCLTGSKSLPINLGCGYGISIKMLVKTLKSVIDFDAYYNTSKPSSFPRRTMEISLAKKLVGFEPRTSLSEALKKIRIGM